MGGPRENQEISRLIRKHSHDWDVMTLTNKLKWWSWSSQNMRKPTPSSLESFVRRIRLSYSPLSNVILWWKLLASNRETRRGNMHWLVQCQQKTFSLMELKMRTLHQECAPTVNTHIVVSHPRNGSHPLSNSLPVKEQMCPYNPPWKRKLQRIKQHRLVVFPIWNLKLVVALKVPLNRLNSDWMHLILQQLIKVTKSKMRRILMVRPLKNWKWWLKTITVTSKNSKGWRKRLKTPLITVCQRRIARKHFSQSRMNLGSSGGVSNI